MNLDDLERALLKILKKCSKLSFKEQIAFLLKKSEKADDNDLKVVIYLYINYLIQQYNIKGTTPFVLPQLSEIKQISSKVSNQEVELTELLDSPPSDLPKIKGGGLYNEPIAKVNSSSSKNLYQSSSGKTGYQENYTPVQPGDHYNATMGIKKKDSYSQPSELEELAGPSVKSSNVERFDTGYSEKKSELEKRKEEEKKVLYG
jgi:hypothetical protein